MDANVFLRNFFFKTGEIIPLIRLRTMLIWDPFCRFEKRENFLAIWIAGVTECFLANTADLRQPEGLKTSARLLL